MRIIHLNEWLNPWTSFMVDNDNERNEARLNALKAKFNISLEGMDEAFNAITNLHPFSTYYFWAGRLDRPAVDNTISHDYHKNHLGIFDYITLGIPRAIESFCRAHWTTDTNTQDLLPIFTIFMHGSLHALRMAFGAIMTLATYATMASLVVGSLVACLIAASIVALGVVPGYLVLLAKNFLDTKRTAPTGVEIDTLGKPALSTSISGAIVTKTRSAGGSTTYTMKENLGKAKISEMTKVVVEGDFTNAGSMIDTKTNYISNPDYVKELNAVPMQDRKLKLPENDREAPLRTVFFIKGKPNDQEKSDARNAAVADQKPREYLFIVAKDRK